MGCVLMGLGDSYIVFGALICGIEVVLLISGVFKIKKSLNILDNLVKSYLELKSTYLCGYTCSKIEVMNSSHYFEVDYGNLRDIRIENETRVCIDHKDGTYYLLLENKEEVIIEVKKRMIEYLKNKLK